MLWLRKFLIGLVLLMRDTAGKGGDDEAPSYTSSTRAKELEDLLYGKSTALAGMSYEDWLKRITPTGAGATLGDTALSKYSDLLNTQDYGLTDYKKTEQDYLDTLLRKYGESRTETWKPLKERLIGENLYESGPGFQMEREFGEETGVGVSDITKQWAYEGIQREMQQKTYMDALKRGDYATAYQLALSEATKESQLAQTATNYQFNALNPVSTLYGQITEQDLARYQAAMNEYENRDQGNWLTGATGGWGTVSDLAFGSSSEQAAQMAALGFMIGFSSIRYKKNIKEWTKH